MIVDQKLNKRFVGIYLIDNGTIDGTQLATTTKPNWFRMLTTRWFLGWKWISIEEFKVIQEDIKIKFATSSAKKLKETQEALTT